VANGNSDASDAARVILIASIRELSVQEDDDGITYLKIEPLHAPSVVYETGDSEPTKASSPVPTPSRFEAKGLRYRFLAFDPADLTRFSLIKDWAAKLRLKYQLHDRGDHYEIELLALPKANGIAIRYTTDGTSPTNAGFATYDGTFRVPERSRVVCAMAVCSEYNLNSEPIRIAIPQRGQETRPPIDAHIPARWNQQTKLDDSGAVWDFIQRLEQASNVRAYDVHDILERAESRRPATGVKISADAKSSPRSQIEVDVKPSAADEMVGRPAIQSSDYWVKTGDWETWVLIEPTEEGAARAYFIDETFGVFDELIFSSAEEALEALRQNGFDHYSEDKIVQSIYSPPLPPFHRTLLPNRLYSFFWTDIPVSEKNALQKIATLLQKYEPRFQLDGAFTPGVRGRADPQFLATKTERLQDLVKKGLMEEKWVSWEASDDVFDSVRDDGAKADPRINWRETTRHGNYYIHIMALNQGFPASPRLRR
jgi:hypothetical protein